MKKRDYTKPNKRIGQHFGRWVIIGYVGWVNKKSIFNCRCECGEVRSIKLDSLKDGSSKSCGCWKKERIKKEAKTHGLSRSSDAYKSWTYMKSRCNNKNHKAYPDYGGRGISVCERWSGRMGFINFLKDMGERPSKNHSLDRYPNNNGNYEPGNCRWATRSEQQRNRRNNIFITMDGQTKCLRDWCNELGISDTIIRWRHSNGLSWGESFKMKKNKQIINRKTKQRYADSALFSA